jgi:hypothetical protein
MHRKFRPSSLNEKIVTKVRAKTEFSPLDTRHQIFEDNPRKTRNHT